MSRPFGVALVRGLSRALALVAPAGVRREYGASFPDAAEHRWRRERIAGAGGMNATLVTMGLLIADFVVGWRAFLDMTRRCSPPERRPLMINRLTGNVRYALRALGQTPLLTVVGTVSIALGIGANTAVFTVANALLFAPARGIDHVDRLVDVGRTTDGRGFDTVSYPTYADLRDRARTLTGVIALRPEPRPLSLSVASSTELAYGLIVSSNYFDVLGVTPAVGSVFHTQDERAGTPVRQVVLSHAFWRRRFGGEPGVVGTAIVLNGDAFTISGIAPTGFQGMTILSPDVWLPLTALARATPTEDLLRSRDSLWLMLSARLAPGATIDQARAETTAFMRGLTEAYPETYRRHGLAVEPSRRTPVSIGVIGSFLAMLLGLVGLVLVVVCANLSGLLMARAGARTREIAVRLALGASRASLVAMFLVESLVLFLPGAALAWLVALAGIRVIESIATRLPVPIDAGLRIDWHVLAYTAVVTVSTALVTGLAPAWHAARGDLVGDLTRDARTPRRQRLRHVFVGAQLALCLVSIVLAGLLMRSLRAMTTISPGFQIDRVDVASVDLSLAGYGEDRAAPATEAVRGRLAALPGVESVAAAAVVPLAGDGLGFGALRRAGDPASEAILDADWSAITPGYLPTLGVRLVRGRNFIAADRGDAPRVAIINERFARLAWPGRDPIGQLLEMGDFHAGHEKSVERLAVVGVAADAKYRWIGETPRQFIYVPLAQQPRTRPYFFLRRGASLSPTAPLEPAVRQVLREFDRRLPLVDFAPLQQYADLGLLPQRIAASVAGSLGSLALALAAMGLYGLTAFMVSSRTREIGVRIALGASRGRVIRLVVGEGLRLAAIGGTIGLVLALVATRLVSSLIVSVSPIDPVAFGTSVLTLVGVASAATYLPARRAARLDPADALRRD
jgi:predicted permease